MSMCSEPPECLRCRLPLHKVYFYNEFALLQKYVLTPPSFRHQSDKMPPPKGEAFEFADLISFLRLYHICYIAVVLQ